MGDTPDGRDPADVDEAGDTDPESSQHSGSLIARLLGLTGAKAREQDPDGHAPSVEETLRNRELLVNLRNMRTLRLDDVSVPRADIIAVPDDITLDELVEVFRKNTVSRIPVYTESLDQPVGLVHLKDLALKYGFGATEGPIDLKTMMRPLIFAPPSMPIGALLNKMQSSRAHMALVIDEYGGVDGLVTIEDLLEQIVGEIADEHDEDETEHWMREGPGLYLLDARADLEDFEEVIGLKLADPELVEEVDTVGGLVFLLTGRVPARGEIVSHPEGHEFDIVEADARRIHRLRFRPRHEGSDAPGARAAE